MTYKSRIDNRTILTYDGKKCIISQEGENWGDPWPTPSYSVEISNIAALLEALKDVQKETYGVW